MESDNHGREHFYVHHLTVKGSIFAVSTVFERAGSQFMVRLKGHVI